MNYRHAYHAGNFADCVKHALLLALLTHLHNKPAPFAVLDTHAGPGFVSLADPEPQKTGEWRNGIARLLDQPPEPLRPYVSLVQQLGLYPGSPELIRSQLRASDRLIACELHPEDAATLRRRFARDARVAIHHRDGYEAVRALLPPPERRGLVLLDPPYEAETEFPDLVEALATAHARFPGAILAAWYPIKGRAQPRAFHDALAASRIPDIVAAEFFLRDPTDAARLDGCGLAIINPPYRYETVADQILAALATRLADPDHPAPRLLRLADE